MLENTVKNLTKPLIVDEDGYVFKAKSVNVSGQPSTTPDNTLSHILIMFYYLIRIFMEVSGTDVPPTYEQCVDNFINLMGDDNFSGFLKGFYHMDPERMKQFVKDLYAEFGLLVKDSALKMQYKEEGEFVDDFEFLGCTVMWNDTYNKYTPVPRIEKFFTSLLYSARLDTVEIYAQRINGLAHLTYGNDTLASYIYDVASRLVGSYYNYLSPATLTQLCEVVTKYTTLARYAYGLE